MGKLPDRRYEMLSSDYEKEQQEIEIVMEEIREKLTQFEDDTDRTEEFLSLVHKYTDIQELTPAIVNEFVDRVLVHKIEEMDGDRMQEISPGTIAATCSVPSVCRSSSANCPAFAICLCLSAAFALSSRSDKLPVFTRDYLEYEGGYYTIGEGHKDFVAEKSMDDDNYILTLAANHY